MAMWRVSSNEAHAEKTVPLLIHTHLLQPQTILASVQRLSPLAGPTCQSLQVPLCITD